MSSPEEEFVERLVLFDVWFEEIVCANGIGLNERRDGLDGFR